MAEKKLIAVASSDGKYVDMHFGHTEKFYIYEADDDGFSFKEIRDVDMVCTYKGHNPGQIEENAEVLSDCDYLLVSRIGPGADEIVRSHGIAAFEIPGEINESLTRLRQYVQISDLLDFG